jgi:hypothetical protein
MDLKETAQTIGKAIADKAPFLGAALGGLAGGAPGGMVGKLAGDVIKKYFGNDLDTPQAMEEAIQQDPQGAAKLALAEMEFKLELRKVDLEETKAFLADVNSARDREVKIVQATGKKDTSTEVMAWIIVLGFFTVLITRMLVKIDPSQTENVGMLIGCLITMTTTIVAYKWGSSKGSAQKAQAMEDSLLQTRGQK